MFDCGGDYSLVHPVPDACLETIDTDRPHQTDTPHLVPTGHVQVESALTEVQLGGTVDGTDETTHVVFFETEYRFGVLSNADFELLFVHGNYVTDTSRFVPPGPLEVRVKLALIRERGARPAVTVVPSVWVPFAASAPLRLGALAFFGWELPFGFELEANVGVVFGPEVSPRLVLASALTHAIASKLSGFVDVYATGYDVQLGTGLLLPVSRDVQLDAGTYVGLAGAEFRATPFVGLSLRR